MVILNFEEFTMEKPELPLVSASADLNGKYALNDSFAWHVTNWDL